MRLVGFCILMHVTPTLADAPVFTFQYDADGKDVPIKVMQGPGDPEWPCTRTQLPETKSAVCKQPNTLGTGQIGLAWAECSKRVNCIVLTTVAYPENDDTMPQPLGIVLNAKVPRIEVKLAESAPIAAATTLSPPVQQAPAAEEKKTSSEKGVSPRDPQTSTVDPNALLTRATVSCLGVLIAILGCVAFLLYRQPTKRWIDLTLKQFAERLNTIQVLLVEQKAAAHSVAGRLSALTPQPLGPSLTQRELYAALEKLERHLADEFWMQKDAQRVLLDELQKIGKFIQKNAAQPVPSAPLMQSNPPHAERKISSPSQLQEIADGGKQKLLNIAAEYRDALPNVDRSSAFMKKYATIPLEKSGSGRLVECKSEKPQFLGIPMEANSAAIVLSRNMWTAVERLTGNNWEGARELCDGIFELSDGENFVTLPAIATLNTSSAYEVKYPGKLELAAKKTS